MAGYVIHLAVAEEYLKKTKIKGRETLFNILQKIKNVNNMFIILVMPSSDIFKNHNEREIIQDFAYKIVQNEFSLYAILHITTEATIEHTNPRTPVKQKYISTIAYNAPKIAQSVALLYFKSMHKTLDVITVTRKSAAKFIIKKLSTYTSVNEKLTFLYKNYTLQKCKNMSNTGDEKKIYLSYQIHGGEYNLLKQ